MPRTKSSLLAFNLREFLDTPCQQRCDGAQKEPCVPCKAGNLETALEDEPGFAAMRAGAGALATSGEAVWVDCFFYGFYIEKSKVASLKQSLGQQPAGRPWQSCT